nr:MAG TPA: hypothetical protein [Caudoviricetes sp.]
MISFSSSNGLVFFTSPLFGFSPDTFWRCNISAYLFRFSCRVVLEFDMINSFLYCTNGKID